MMRIALIAHSLRAGGGVSVAKNIIDSLGRIAPENEYFISIPNLTEYKKVYVNLPSCKTSVFDGGGNVFKRLKYEVLDLPTELKRFEPDVIFCLGNMGVFIKSVSQAIMCQDAHLFFPGKQYGKYFSLRGFIKDLVRCLIFWVDLKTTNLVICQTQVAEHYIRKVYGYKRKILVCPNSLSKDVQESSTITPTLTDKIDVCEDKIYLFYPTGYDPHKNLEILVELFKKYKKELYNYRVILTINASHHPRAKGFLNSIEQAGLQDFFINIGTIDQNELHSYYRKCDAVIMPTVLESYSGVYLEAMYFGIPIITSDLDFAHEICGEAALYIDPYSVQSIFQSLQQLKHSNSLSDKGKVRFQSIFRSWDNIGSDIIKALCSISK